MEHSRSTPLMSVDQMYKITRGENAVWGIEGYEVPKVYLDPARQIKDREYLTQKKGQKSSKLITKKGHFLEDIAKQTMCVPGPQKYDTTYKWVDEKLKEKPRPKSVPTDRGSFIDMIFKVEKKRGNPGVGKYNVTRTIEDQKKIKDEQAKKKINHGNKGCYLSEFEHLGNVLPGPGNYNPRHFLKEILPKLKQNATKPDFWIKSHKAQLEKSKKSLLPDIGTYKHYPVDHFTFGKQLHLIETKQVGEKKKANYWGSEARFKDLKKSKSKMLVQVPEPGRYPLIAQWPGKQEAQNKEKKVTNWMDKVTKGVQRSIYQQ